MCWWLLTDYRQKPNLGVEGTLIATTSTHTRRGLCTMVLSLQLFVDTDNHAWNHNYTLCNQDSKPAVIVCSIIRGYANTKLLNSRGKSTEQRDYNSFIGSFLGTIFMHIMWIDCTRGQAWIICVIAYSLYISPIPKECNYSSNCTLQSTTGHDFN